jgi:hypothetical protein
MTLPAGAGMPHFGSTSGVNTPPGRTSIAALAAALAPADDPQVLARALDARAGEFRRALCRGGTRAEFARWQAGLDALQAALAILGQPDSTRPGPRPAPDGDTPWTSLSARSTRP